MSRKPTLSEAEQRAAEAAQALTAAKAKADRAAEIAAKAKAAADRISAIRAAKIANHKKHMDALLAAEAERLAWSRWHGKAGARARLRALFFAVTAPVAVVESAGWMPGTEADLAEFEELALLFGKYPWNKPKTDVNASTPTVSA